MLAVGIRLKKTNFSKNINPQKSHPGDSTPTEHESGTKKIATMST